MSKWEKIFFWLGLPVIVMDNLYWQWWIKLTVDPPFEFLKGRGLIIDFAFDILFLIAWIFVLIRIYKKANREQAENMQ